MSARRATGVCLCVLFLLGGRPDASPSVAAAAKIALIPGQHTSHVLSMTAAAEHLLRRGHDLHLALADNMRENGASLQRIGFTIHYFKATPIFYRVEELTRKVVKMACRGENVVAHFAEYISFTADCEAMTDDSSFLEKLRAEKFDYAIADGLHISRCHGLIPHNLGVRFSLISSEVDLAMRHTLYPSIFHSLLTSSSPSEGVSLIDKFINLAQLIVSEFDSLSPIKGHRNHTVLHKMRRSKDIVSYGQVAREAEMFFVSCDSIIEKRLPFFSNSVLLGGITNQVGQKLSEKFDDFLAQSAAGTVVFSFGSSFHLHDFDSKQRNIIFRSIAKRPEAFVIVDTSDSLPGLPDNARLFKWIPQNDLLADVRVKLFIGHGGMNGQNEAMYHGLPMLCIPLQNEQQFNALRVTELGIGMTLLVHQFDERELDEKLSELLDNETIRRKARHVSRIIRSRPMNGKQLLAFWIEHLLEFGDEHLRPPGLNMSAFQFYMLDMLAILFVVFFSMSLCSMLACKWLIGRFCCKRSEDRMKHSKTKRH